MGNANSMNTTTTDIFTMPGLKGEKVVESTMTLVIGFSALLLFVVCGVLVSVFICLTLKKDYFLWNPEEQASRKQSTKLSEVTSGADSSLM